ncbi:MAG: GNAT family N-acetyltransferase [Kaiparowitsia implicata GSE-PSE-MK54-09C]|jgi:RimJ/RimL family protein N-acetyltransferase|nr:GNAT family N-acetyltransferase [Kaiparowitsia implicata GSE-PSE-MK54-09C]
MEFRVRNGFCLTSIRSGDRAAYLEHLNDRSISDSIPALPYPYTAAAADGWIQHRLEFLTTYGKEISFALRNPTEDLIGSVGVDDFRLGQTHRAEVGYWLATAYRGQNLMSDALGVFVSYAFDHLELTRLTAHTLAFNVPSAKVLEKNKFKHEGCLRHHTQTRNGIFDTLVWGLLKGEEGDRLNTLNP